MRCFWWWIPSSGPNFPFFISKVSDICLNIYQLQIMSHGQNRQTINQLFNMYHRKLCIKAQLWLIHDFLPLQINSFTQVIMFPPVDIAKVDIFFYILFPEARKMQWQWEVFVFQYHCRLAGLKSILLPSALTKTQIQHK